MVPRGAALHLAVHLIRFNQSFYKRQTQIASSGQRGESRMVLRGANFPLCPSAINMVGAGAGMLFASKFVCCLQASVCC